MGCRSNFKLPEPDEIIQLWKIKVWQHRPNLLIFGDVQSQLYGLFGLILIPTVQRTAVLQMLFQRWKISTNYRRNSYIIHRYMERK